MEMCKSGRKILEKGKTCWRIENAERASVLIDAGAYFGALRQALLNAQGTVFIVGWDVDSRTQLVGPSGEAEDALPVRLGPFLTALVKKRPELKIHILLWDYAMLYGFEREPLPSINLAWKTPNQISVCLDDVLPIGSSHHQKIVVIDDRLAFSGGLDLTTRRWDTPEHELTSALRRDFAGQPYRPFHDIQMMVDGPAAQALAELVRQRWRDAACETPAKTDAREDPWPDSVEPDFRDVDIGIARTLPVYGDRPEIREVEALYKRAIACAEKSIYLENQFLTAGNVARALATRMRENPDLEVLIVGPNVQHSWLEERSMNAGRRRFMDLLRQAGVGERVRLLFPAVQDDDTGEGVMVHAKLMIVDDCCLRVGSANLNNRSMGVDTECDLALEARDGPQREKVAAIRNHLLAEHLGHGEDTVAASILENNSLLGAVDDLSGKNRTLRPIDLSSVPIDDVTSFVAEIADPERPIATPTFVGDLFGGTVINQFPGRFLKLLVLVSAIVGLIALWRLTALSEFLGPGVLLHWIDGMRQELWLPLAIPILFVLAGFVAFPVTVLIAMMGMMFSPLVAMTYSLVGSLMSAIVIFAIGAIVGRRPLRRYIGLRVNRISRALARRGVLSVTALRLVPLAPFSVVNLVAGASHIRFADYLVGTLLGMAPGILIMSLAGRQLMQTLSNPSPIELLLFALCVLGWLFLSVALQVAATRLRARQDG